MSEPLHTKQQTLTDKFFADIDAQLLDELRANLNREKEIEALGDAAGVQDPAVLKELMAMNIGPETLSAFRMVPLVAVAWSDHVLQKEERETLLEAATRRGIVPGSASYRLLDQWLQREPPRDLLVAWIDYVEEICKSLTPAAISALRAEVMGQAEMVAQSSGGFLGMGSVNRQESEVLKQLRGAFPQ